MSNDMISPDDLNGLPGAPFSEAEVDSAVAALRAAAGWHIAPVRADVGVALDVACVEPVLRLPTRRLISVEEVRDADNGKVIDPKRYRTSHTFARLRRKGGFWPDGYEAVEVDMTHGYAEVPGDLLPLIGHYALMERRDSTVQSVRVDDASVSYQTTATATSTTSASPLSSSSVLARYALPGWPGTA